MGKIKVFTVVAVMALISSGMFSSCQKENESVFSSDVSSKNVKSISLFYDNILTNSIPYNEFSVYLRELGHRYVAEEWQGYLCFSRNAGSIKYGYSTESINGEIYNYMTSYFEEIMSNGTYDENWKDFEISDLDGALNWLEQGIFNSQDATIFEYEGKLLVILEKQQNSFIIVTEEEMQYLGNPESIEEFKNNISNYIDVAVDMMDCYFVFQVHNGIVQNGQVSKSPTYPILSSWANRLYGYVEIAKIYPIIDDFDEIPILDGVCQTFSKRKYAKDFTNALIDRDDVESVCVTKNENGTYTVCWEYKK